MDGAGSLGRRAVDRKGACNVTEVRDNPQRSRYEIAVDGAVIGFVEYTRHDDVVTLTHTEVDAARREQGLASELVREALDDVRAHNLGLVVRCEFVKWFIERHPEYADLQRV
jgi:predicted GNAT family acetyltransferase